MIAMDMDGTLLNERGLISDRNKRALQESERRGIKIILASGRNALDIRTFYREAGLTSPMLSINGVRADESPDGPIIFHSFLSERTTVEILGVLRELELFLAVFTPNASYSENASGKYLWRKRGKIVDGDIVSEIVVNEPARTNSEALYQSYKVITCGETDKIARARELLRALDVDLSSSWADNIEICQPGINKGTGLARLAKHYGIDRSEVMAFGDYFNDIEMLEWAGESFAMENGAPEVKKIAKRIALSNVQDGVGRAIEEFAL